MCDRAPYGQHTKYKSASLCLTIIVCALVCLHTCSCLHTRPGLTLLQFAPFGTAMWLVCKDWRQTAVLVCAITQPLLSALCLGSWAQDTKHSAAVQNSDACSACCLFPPLCPAKTCLYPFPTCFNRTVLGVLVSQRKKTGPTCRKEASTSVDIAGTVK